MNAPRTRPSNHVPHPRLEFAVLTGRDEQQDGCPYELIGRALNAGARIQTMVEDAFSEERREERSTGKHSTVADFTPGCYELNIAERGAAIRIRERQTRQSGEPERKLLSPSQAHTSMAPVSSFTATADFLSAVAFAGTTRPVGSETSRRARHGHCRARTSIGVAHPCRAKVF